QLTRAGHRVHFITWDMPYPLSAAALGRNLRQSWRPWQKQLDDVLLHHVARTPLFSGPLNGALFRLQTRAIARRCALRAIVSESYTSETEAPAGVPLLYDVVDDHAAFAAAYGSRTYKAAFRLLGSTSAVERQARAAGAVTAVSDRLVRWSEQRNKCVYKLPNGIDSALLDAPRLPPVAGSLLYVSNFGPWSRLPELLSALHQLAPAVPALHLTLAGGGTALPGAQRLAHRLRLDERVTFLGPVSDRAYLSQLMGTAEVCLNLSDKNAFRDAASPIKVMEYLARGHKILSTPLDEIAALAAPSITLQRPGEPLAEALRRVLSAPLPPAPSPALLRERTWEHLAAQLEAIVRQMLSSAP
ncbi:MAG: glycosyltransferase, partial [Chloroflexota bacterium]